MVGVTKLRIKFGPEGAVKTFQIEDNNTKKVEEAIGEHVVKASDKSRKRGPSELEEVQANKKQKLDRGSSSQCLTCLRSLRDHKLGWIFSEPVDPVKLKIPDYFKVISKPMDLGTIKSKLLRNEYNSTDEFAADVRLTFANAMLYNPPDNAVHQMAKELKEIFEVKWESLKRKKISNLSGIEVTEASQRQPGEVNCTRRSVSSGRSARELTKPVKEKSEKVSLLAKSMKGQSQKDTPVDTPLATKLRIKKLEHGLGVSSTMKIPCPGSAPTAAGNCGSCGRVTCICLKSCNSSGSEVSSLTDCQIMNTPGVQASESDPHSSGSVNSRNEKNGCVSSQLDNPPNSNEFKTTFPAMPPLPPEKALRAAMLKSQFAETILKAKHRKVLDQSNKADLIRIQIEKEQMERTQREEKERIEAEMRAAKCAAQMRAKTELNEQRERERLKREKLEKTCGLDECCFETLDKDLVYLCGSSNVTRSMLLELGLVLRDEYCPELELELSGAMRVDDIEEGEIL